MSLRITNPPFAFPANSLPAEDEKDLGAEVFQLFDRSCHKCHGGEKTAKRLRILDFDALRKNSDLITPGKPEESFLFRRIVDGEMPPENTRPPLTAAEQNVVEKWIQAGLPDPRIQAKGGSVQRLEEAERDRLIGRDLSSLGLDEVRAQTRYFTFDSIDLGDNPQESLSLYRQALSKLLNSLSWFSRVVAPTPVDPDGFVYRIDLRDYGWSPEIWRRIERLYPYTSSEELAKELAQASHTEIPVVRGDWFIATACKPPLYYDVLDLPGTLSQTQRLLGFQIADDLLAGRVYRAAFPGKAVAGGSGITFHNRLIERHDTPNGSFRLSYDVKIGNGSQNFFNAPLFPERLGVKSDGLSRSLNFSHDGNEVIFSLPNGAQAYMLFDKNGKRVDEVPQEIALSDINPEDPVVRPGVSCMQCHVKGVQRRTDQLQAHLAQIPPTDSKRTNLFAFYVNRFYGRSAEYERLKNLDEENYLTALARAGVDSTRPDPVSIVQQRYQLPVSAAQAAAELGKTPEALRAALADQPQLRTQLQFLLDSSPQGMTRADFERLYQNTVATLSSRKE